MSWPASCRPSRFEERHAPIHRGHRHRAGDDIEGIIPAVSSPFRGLALKSFPVRKAARWVRFKGSPHDRPFPVDCRNCKLLPCRQFSGYGSVHTSRPCDECGSILAARSTARRAGPAARRGASERGRTSPAFGRPGAVQRQAGQAEESRQQVSGQRLRRLFADRPNPPAPSHAP